MCLGSQFQRRQLFDRTGLQRTPRQRQHVPENRSLRGGCGTESTAKEGQV